MTNFGKLTQRRAELGLHLPAGRSSVRYGDGGGLYVQITRTASGNETRAWLFRYTSPITKKKRDMGLGRLKTYELDEARERARMARQLLDKGIDPIEARDTERAERAAAVPMMTFEKATAGYLKDHARQWTNKVHRGQWQSTLAALSATFNATPVNLIKTETVASALEDIWHETPETASRVRARIEAVLGWCKGRGYRSGENPARWKENLDAILPKPSKLKRPKVERHHAALAYDAVPAFMEALAGVDERYARFFEVLILTAVRLGELAQARWSEMDLRARLWIIPTAKTKHKQMPHRVPLSPRVVEILENLPRGEADALVFPSEAKPQQPISGTPLYRLLTRLSEPTGDGKKPTLHGFRASFSSWRAARTHYPADAAEAQLGHVIGRDDSERAYQRDDLLEMRLKLMAAWEKFCLTPPSETGAVIPMRPTGVP
jgi:integrase